MTIPSSGVGAKSPVNRVILLVVLTGVLASSAAILVVHRHYLMDDAFITYRYAKHLAEGEGITWNRGEAPVEGYTDFLLVVVLAPVTKAGIDPLLATRVMSLLSIVGLGWAIARISRRLYVRDNVTAALIGLTFIAAGPAVSLATLGLETVMFTLALTLAFDRMLSFLDTRSSREAGFLGVALLSAILLRPEGGLFAVIAIVSVLPALRGLDRRQTRAAIVAAVTTLILPLCVYLGWKLWHFGSIVPNTFFVKATGSKLISPLGAMSVLAYFNHETKLLVLALLSWPMAGVARQGRIVALVFVASYAAWFIRVDTVMDIYDRFLYPLTPFLFFLAMPVACTMLEHLLNWRANPVIKIPVVTGVIFLLFPAAPRDELYTMHAALQMADEFGGPSGKSLRELRERDFGRRLAQFPDIRNVRIALGDAGVIPYETDAPVLDVVGLNDRVIARERNLNRLVDYFFSVRPTLVLHPALDGAWLDYGHGPLGNYRTWATDPRWDDYSYIGTVQAGYDLHLLLRKDYSRFDELASFIKGNVADRIDDPFALPIGTRPGVRR